MVGLESAVKYASKYDLWRRNCCIVLGITTGHRDERESACGVRAVALDCDFAVDCLRGWMAVLKPETLCTAH